MQQDIASTPHACIVTPASVSLGLEAQEGRIAMLAIFPASPHFRHGLERVCGLRIICLKWVDGIYPRMPSSSSYTVLQALAASPLAI